MPHAKVGCTTHIYIWIYKARELLQEEVRVRRQKIEGAEAYSQHLLALLQTHYLQRPSLHKSKAWKISKIMQSLL